MGRTSASPTMPSSPRHSFLMSTPLLAKPPSMLRSFHSSPSLARPMGVGSMVVAGVLVGVVFLGPRVVIPRIVEAIKMTKEAVEGKPKDEAEKKTEAVETKAEKSQGTDKEKNN